ncbi:MAG: trigger factor [Candidatus Saccharimonadales bacterium]
MTKHTMKKQSDTRVILTVEVDQKTIAQAKILAIKELGKSVKVSGFRPGKVPANVVEKSIDPNMLANETVEYAVNRAVNTIIDEKELRVLDQPKIELKKFVPFDTLEFTAEFEVLPEVKLADYTKLKATKKAEAVTAKDVTDVIERMRQGMAERSEATRAVKDGDEVTMDFTGKGKDGELIEGASGADYTLTVGSQTFIPGFEEQLIGHNAGETFDISVTFPSDYHAEHLKSAEVVFTVDLKKVQEITLPTIDDEFAKKAGPFETAAALKADIKKELAVQNERRAIEERKDELLGQLVEASTVPVPAVLVHDQMHALEQDAMQNLMYRGQTLDQYLSANGHKDKEAWQEAELKPMAERRVQAGLVIAELSKAEKIDVSAEELEAELARRKQEAPAMADQLDSPESRRDLANRVVTEKTINRLLDLNS